MASTPKTALVIFTEGAEEMETVCTVDVLRRGGVEVTLAGLANGDAVLCSRNVRVLPDAALSDVSNKQYDAIVLPGGLKNAQALAESSTVGDLLRAQQAANRVCAAICASTMAFAAHGIGKGKKVTSHPSVKDRVLLGTENKYEYTESRVEHDDIYVTSRGPGTAIEFGLKLVEVLVDKEKADSLKAPMLHKD